MPERITVENLRIEDAGYPTGYKGTALFSDFNREMNDETYVEKYPYIITKEVIINKINTASGKPLIVSSDKFMFKRWSYFKGLQPAQNQTDISGVFRVEKTF